LTTLHLLYSNPSAGGLASSEGGLFISLAPASLHHLQLIEPRPSSYKQASRSKQSMVAVAAPAPGDLDGLERVLDQILGAKMAKLFGGADVSLLDRVEVREGKGRASPP
jgi:hypothetical protein